MSASKEQHGHANGGRMVRAIKSRRCPVCGGDSWCSWGADGAKVTCMRNVSEHARVAIDGTPYWIHVLSPDARPEFVEGPDASGPDVERSSVDVRDAAYRLLLSELRLTDAHEKDLIRRGLGVAIRENQYRTFPLEGRSAIARRIVDRIGETAARGVPGIYVAERDGRTYFTLAGSPGLLIPLRNPSGQVVAIKVRRDGDCDGPRYTSISSARHGGARAMNAAHVPTFAGDRSLVRVTEGELKADATTAMTSVLTISVPGVGAWQSAMPVLRELGARTVVVSFDADHRVKPEVGTAVAALSQAVHTAGYELVIERWDARAGKGVDDVFLADRGGSIVVLEGSSAKSYAAYCEVAAARQRRARQQTEVAA